VAELCFSFKGVVAAAVDVSCGVELAEADEVMTKLLR
jgi:hypothetical protein